MNKQNEHMLPLKHSSSCLIVTTGVIKECSCGATAQRDADELILKRDYISKQRHLEIVREIKEVCNSYFKLTDEEFFYKYNIDRKVGLEEIIKQKYLKEK